MFLQWERKEKIGKQNSKPKHNLGSTCAFHFMQISKRTGAVPESSQCKYIEVKGHLEQTFTESKWFKIGNTTTKMQIRRQIYKFDGNQQQASFFYQSYNGPRHWVLKLYRQLLEGLLKRMFSSSSEFLVMYVSAFHNCISNLRMNPSRNICSGGSKKMFFSHGHKGGVLMRHRAHRSAAKRKEEKLKIEEGAREKTG